MFSNLPKQEKSIVIDAMEEKCFEAGATVIKQDDAGDVLYVVEEGLLDCSKVFVSLNLNELLIQFLVAIGRE